MSKVVNLFDRGVGLQCLKDIYGLNNEQIRNIENRVFSYDPPLLSEEEKEEQISTFKDIYGENGEETKLFIKLINNKSRRNCILADDCVELFLEQTGIEPDVFDLSDVKLLFRHVTSVIDNGKSIREKGLLRLDELLESSSPLSDFLKRNNIIICPSKKIIYVDGNSYDIDYKGKFGILASKLYHDLGEIEMFVCGSDIVDYSCIAECPEILCTLDEVLKNKKLHNKWLQYKTDLFIIEFLAGFDECIIHQISNDSNGLEQYLSKDYSGNIPINVGRNYWIIKRCLENANPKSYGSEEYAAIKSDVRINPERLKLIRQ